MKRIVKLVIALCMIGISICMYTNVRAEGNIFRKVFSGEGYNYWIEYEFRVPEQGEVTFTFENLEDSILEDFDINVEYVKNIDTGKKYLGGFTVRAGKTVTKRVVLPAGNYLIYLDDAMDHRIIVTNKITAYLKKTSFTLAKGNTATLSIGNSAGKTITWSSSNKKIATVSSKGVIKAIAKGTATITGKVSDGTTLKASVRVADLKSKKQTISIGRTATLKVLNYGSAKIEWKSSNSKVATVSKKGVVKAVGVGTAYIKAYVNGGKKALTATIKVIPKLNKTSAILTKGDKLTLKVIGTTKKVTWSSSNTNVATVSSSGVVTAKSNGTATIRAKVGTTILKCTIKVKSKVTWSVTVYDESIYNEAYITFYNNSKKKITYIRFNIIQYNKIGNRLSSPYSYYYFDDDIRAGESETRYWYVNDATRKVKIIITKVYFSDGSTWSP